MTLNISKLLKSISYLIINIIIFPLYPLYRISFKAKRKKFLSYIALNMGFEMMSLAMREKPLKFKAFRYRILIGHDDSDLLIFSDKAQKIISDMGGWKGITKNKKTIDEFLLRLANG